jgi:hypothetical protein
MTTRVEIPGGFAILREQDELRGRDRNLIKAAAMAAAAAIEKMPESVQEGRLEGESDEDLQARLQAEVEKVDLSWEEGLSLLELRQATVVAVLQEWSLPLPLPTMKDIDLLPADLYDALDTAIGGVTNAVANAVDFEPQPGKENPTGSSTSSEAPSDPSDPAPLSIPSIPSDGESTPIESSTPV